MTTSIETVPSQTIADVTQNVVSAEAQHKSKKALSSENVSSSDAYRDLDEKVADILLESGVYEEPTFGEGDNESIIKELGRTKRRREVFQASISRVLDNLSAQAEQHDDERVRAEMQEAHTISSTGSEFVLQALGIQKPKEAKEVKAELKKEVSTDREITIDHDLFKKLTAISRLDTNRGIQTMANDFIDVYSASNLAIDAIRSKTKKSPEDNQRELNAVGQANLYTRFLGDIIKRIDNNSARTELSRVFGHIVQASAERRNRGGDRIDVDATINNVAQMMTGLKLEIGSIDALKECAEQFGWQSVEDSSISEDVQMGTDAYITRADGVRVPIDFKSKNSFLKQRGVDTGIDGVKTKKTKGTKVVVVDSQTLGLKDKATGRVPGVRDFKLYNKYSFAQSVNAAVEQY